MRHMPEMKSGVRSATLAAALLLGAAFGFAGEAVGQSINSAADPYVRCKGGPQDRLPTAPFLIETQRGRQMLTVELAREHEEKACGMMFRQSMGATEGMLFDMTPGGQISMWMRNTVLPLDMVFLDRRGRVVDVIEGAVPFSETVLTARAPAVTVLEVLAGTAKRLGIRVGDRATLTFTPSDAKPD